MVGPSTNRERATLEILKRTLSGYSVYSHMRLANVVKGRTQFKRAMSQYEIDFTVLDMEGEVVCVIELDDPTHDTADGMRRDLNKNTWLREADIPIIRIREPQEAMALKDQVDRFQNTGVSPTMTRTNKPSKSKSKPNVGPKIQKELSDLAIRIIFGGVAALAAIAIIGYGANSAIKRQAEFGKRLQQQATARQQQLIKKQQEQQAHLHQQQLDQLEAARYQQAHQPHYERVFVKGKSAEECGHTRGTALDNRAITCMNDHYEME